MSDIESTKQDEDVEDVEGHVKNRKEDAPQSDAEDDVEGHVKNRN